MEEDPSPSRSLKPLQIHTGSHVKAGNQCARGVQVTCCVGSDGQRLAVKGNTRRHQDPRVKPVSFPPQKRPSKYCTEKRVTAADQRPSYCCVLSAESCCCRPAPTLPDSRRRTHALTHSRGNLDAGFASLTSSPPTDSLLPPSLSLSLSHPTTAAAERL